MMEAGYPANFLGRNRISSPFSRPPDFQLMFLSGNRISSLVEYEENNCISDLMNVKLFVMIFLLQIFYVLEQLQHHHGPSVHDRAAGTDRGVHYRRYRLRYLHS